jgi:hypothetical protein
MNDINTVNGSLEIDLLGLRNRAYFKITFLSVLGFYIVFCVFGIVCIPFGLFDAPNSDEFSLLSVAFIFAVNIILGPVMWAAFLTGGNMLAKKVYKSSQDIKIEFTGNKAKFEEITPESLFRLLLNGCRGIITIYAAFFALILVFSMLLLLLTGEWTQLPISIGVAFIFVLFLTIMPYVWAWIMSIGSYVTKPIVKRFGWGQLKV